MSKKTSLALAALIAVALPAPAFGQIGVGAKIGTLGLGGDVSVGIGSMLALRGGFGVFPGDVNGTLDDIEYTLNPPSNVWNVGVDFYPGLGGFRISAGLLNRKQYEMSAVQEGTTEVGGNTYSGRITLNGSLSNERETAPYFGIGFGRIASSGLGLYLDLGAAAMGEADVQMTGSCVVTSGPGAGSPCPNQAQFNADVQAEAQKAEDDAGSYLKWHPILQIGLKLGF